ncbi:hypothetical protein BC830DRAFT_1167591 [Chytriomyces sp. MP71]|nr:hypothetical protein BC830DRAFT_1167591 [Chytriomyces sp. MP71]
MPKKSGQDDDGSKFPSFGRGVDRRGHGHRFLACAEGPPIPLREDGRRKRVHPTREQMLLLETHFAATPKPSAKERAQICAQVNINMRSVQIWFQNRRARERKTARAGRNPDDEPDSGADTGSVDPVQTMLDSLDSGEDECKRRMPHGTEEAPVPGCDEVDEVDEDEDDDPDYVGGRRAHAAKKARKGRRNAASSSLAVGGTKADAHSQPSPAQSIATVKQPPSAHSKVTASDGRFVLPSPIYLTHPLPEATPHTYNLPPIQPSSDSSYTLPPPSNNLTAATSASWSPPTTDPTAVRILSTELSIGTWRRVATTPSDLLCDFVLSDGTLRYAVVEAGFTFKMEVPVATVLDVSIHPVPGNRWLSSVTLDIGVRPRFYREVRGGPVWGAKADGSGMSFVECDDFTEQGSASSCFRHVVEGVSAEMERLFILIGDFFNSFKQRQQDQQLNQQHMSLPPPSAAEYFSFPHPTSQPFSYQPMPSGTRFDVTSAATSGASATLHDGALLDASCLFESVEDTAGQGQQQPPGFRHSQSQQQQSQQLQQQQQQQRPSPPEGMPFSFSTNGYGMPSFESMLGFS